MVVYLQDKDNISYISYCVQNHEEVDIFCNLTYQTILPGQINNWAVTLFMSRYTLKMHHIIAYTTKSHFNRIYLSEINGDEISEVSLGKGYEGNVTGVEVADKYLYVILKYVKKI